MPDHYCARSPCCFEAAAIKHCPKVRYKDYLREFFLRIVACEEECFIFLALRQAICKLKLFFSFYKYK